MRGNGLEATSYVAIADVDPRVADVLLERLREAGVAAYAVPCQPAQGVLLEVRLPEEPRDRLHVDESAVDTARELVRAQLTGAADDTDDTDTENADDTETADELEDAEEAEDGGRDDRAATLDGAESSGTPREKPDDEPDAGGDHEARTREGRGAIDEDAAFAEIVAAYDTAPDTPVAPWPTSEDTDDAEQPAEGTEDSRAARTNSGDTGESGERGDSEPAKAGTVTGTGPEEGYVPPPPPPLPSLDPVAKAGWVGLVGGPLLLLLATVAGSYVPDWFVPVGVVAFLAGFVVLVTRMRGGPPDESDDGAVV